MVGHDQVQNLILNDAHERVYSPDAPVEQAPLGLYVIRGDNICVIGEFDESKFADEQTAPEALKPIQQQAFWRKKNGFGFWSAFPAECSHSTKHPNIGFCILSVVLLVRAIMGASEIVWCNNFGINSRLSSFLSLPEDDMAEPLQSYNNQSSCFKRYFPRGELLHLLIITEPVGNKFGL